MAVEEEDQRRPLRRHASRPELQVLPWWEGGTPPEGREEGLASPAQAAGNTKDEGPGSGREAARAYPGDDSTGTTEEAAEGGQSATAGGREIHEVLRGRIRGATLG